jgi:RNA polymerase subunit RPABC4/transcription elongation factor Spt4
MKTCPTCKVELADNAKTCPKCGHVFTTESGVAVAVVIGVIAGGFLLWFLTRKL